MARQKIGDKLEAAIKAKAALDAEIKLLAAQERERKRAEDERRFLLLGRTVSHHMADAPDDQLSRDVTALLDRMLTRPGDRALFAFLPKPAPVSTAVSDLAVRKRKKEAPSGASSHS